MRWVFNYGSSYLFPTQLLLLPRGWSAGLCAFVRGCHLTLTCNVDFGLTPGQMRETLVTLHVCINLDFSKSVMLSGLSGVPSKFCDVSRTLGFLQMICGLKENKICLRIMSKVIVKTFLLLKLDSIAVVSSGFALSRRSGDHLKCNFLLLQITRTGL